MMDGDANSALLEKGKLKAATRNIRETFLASFSNQRGKFS